MHEAALAQAALPAPARVLGLLLRPYSLGHELFLIREQNPILSGGEVKPADVAEAALICCQTFKECQRMHADPLMGVKHFLWQLRTFKANVGHELQAFHDYRNSGLLQFPTSEVVEASSGPPGRQPGAPFLLQVHQFLITKLHVPEDKAWDYPMGLAKMQWQTYWESEGAYKIYNAHQAQFDAFCAEMDAKEAAELAQTKEAKCQV